MVDKVRVSLGKGGLIAQPRNHLPVIATQSMGQEFVKPKILSSHFYWVPLWTRLPNNHSTLPSVHAAHSGGRDAAAGVSLVPGRKTTTPRQPRCSLMNTDDERPALALV